MNLTIDPAVVEDVAKELYIRALKVLPPDVKAAFAARDRARDRRDRAARARRDGEEHRGGRGDGQPAVPGHRDPDLQRDDRPERGRRRRRDRGGDPPRLRARDARASAALVGRPPADAAQRADVVRRRRAGHPVRVHGRVRRPEDRDDPEGLGLREQLVAQDGDPRRRRRRDQALRRRLRARRRRQDLPADDRRRRRGRHRGPVRAPGEGRGDAAARHRVRRRGRRRASKRS